MQVDSRNSMGSVYRLKKIKINDKLHHHQPTETGWWNSRLQLTLSWMSLTFRMHCIPCSPSHSCMVCMQVTGSLSNVKPIHLCCSRWSISVSSGSTGANQAGSVATHTDVHLRCRIISPRLCSNSSLRHFKNKPHNLIASKCFITMKLDAGSTTKPWSTSCVDWPLCSCLSCRQRQQEDLWLEFFRIKAASPINKMKRIAQP